MDTDSGSVPFARPNGYTLNLLKTGPRLNGSLALSGNLSDFRLRNENQYKIASNKLVILRGNKNNERI